MIDQVITFIKNNMNPSLNIIQNKNLATPNVSNQFIYNGNIYTWLYDFHDSPIYYDTNTKYITNDFYLFKKDMKLDIVFVPKITIDSYDDDKPILEFNDDCYIEGYPDNGTYFNELYLNKNGKGISPSSNYKCFALHRNINSFLFNYNINDILEHMTRAKYLIFHNAYEKSSKTKSVIDYMKFINVMVTKTCTSRDNLKDDMIVCNMDSMNKSKVSFINKFSVAKIEKMFSNYYSKYQSLYELLEEEYKCI